MSSPVISVEGLSKKYLIGHQSAHSGRYASLRDVIAREVKNFGRKAAELARGEQIVQGDDVEEFWALKNVSFEMQQGEVLGIIGKNGAGKSTLLKVLSRVTEPTEGRIKIRGRAASLLEVGTGFHPELTGRENIFLNGAVLGMRRSEIKRKFDDIVEFAEVGRFVDTPVKRYSSGMYLRLAFAVAAHLEPEILIVDEVLAVGDAGFQRKCLGKIDEVSKREGRTVLFVSHNMGVVASLCPSVIWLENGSVRQQGHSRQVLNEYSAQRLLNPGKIAELDQIPRLHTADQRLRLQSLEWLCDLPLEHGQPVSASLRFKLDSPIEDLCIGIGFSTLDARRLLTYDTSFQDGFCPRVSPPGNYVVKVDIDSLPLEPNIYNLDIGCLSGDVYGLDYLPGVIQIEVIPGPTTPGAIVRDARGTGGVRLASKWVSRTC